MDQLIQTKQLTFTYPNAHIPVLQDVNLTVDRGQFVVIAGATGSGKTTLLNHFKKELLPNGQRSGDVLIQQRSIDNFSKLSSAKTVGYVGQDPTVQPIMTTVIAELAFSLENVGVKSDEIERRVAELANYLGLDQLLHHEIHDLSGGQLQLVNLASVLILRPEILLFDEPTAQLDPLSTQHFFDVLQRLHQELGMTIVMVEHNLETALSLADTMLLLQNHRITFQGAPAVGISKMMNDPKLTAFIPEVPRLFLENRLQVKQLPISVAEGQTAITSAGLRFKSTITKPRVIAPTQPILTAKDVSFSFDQRVNVVDHLSLTLPAGDWLSIVGKNGSGKSTLLTMLAGLQVPQHGKIKFAKQKVWKIPTATRISELSFLSQTPALQFGAETVRDELRQQAGQLHLGAPEKRVKIVIDQLHLNDLLDQNPFDLSSGQQQLLGIGLALLANPKLLILDEPTKGLDPAARQALGDLLTTINQAGTTILMASHDMAFCAAYSRHSAFMFDGHLNTILPTRTFFSANFFFTTAINRLLRRQVQDALLVSDVQFLSEGTNRYDK
ncbi:ABC transporter ATP-binding protein [Lentilactobacillus parakefiri]|uniref:Cobalt ABC transporter ATP-binding protein n=1 Tax=Lentilactobacillus parakefiri TaxID=152332 RepID=A0A269YC04_9LACO|nr:ABC transporter ATP-binding protein [Lentilactobacillus parakefiri]PAK83063.1 cobalt ABC transporter ATP-binding protein [Lentilactobacillus parakefiri]